MSDRGDYAPIARVLRDGPDFQRFSPIARHVFYDLKIAFPASGIAVYYREALVAELHATTGWQGELIAEALRELEVAGWIRCEANIVWIVDHLKYHPNLNPLKDEKHRKGIQNAIRGLPRLAIVGQFIDHYPEYFSDAPEMREQFTVARAISPSIAPARPFEGPSMALGSKKKKKKKEKEKENLPADAVILETSDQPTGPNGAGPPRTDHWLLPSSAVYESKYGAGSFPFPMAGKALKPVHEAGHSAESIAANLSRYLADADPKYVNLQRFAQTFSAWDEPPPIVDPVTGLLNERGMKVMGLSR